jgi:hypothetical protein
MYDDDDSDDDVMHDDVMYDVKAKDRLTRAARESDARRFARTMQQVDVLSSKPVNTHLSMPHI